MQKEHIIMWTKELEIEIVFNINVQRADCKYFWQLIYVFGFIILLAVNNK